MTRVRFHTNLDEAKSDVSALATMTRSDGHIPRVGERVKIRFERDKVYELEVVDVTHEYDFTDAASVCVVSVELHIPRYMQMGIGDWTKYIKKHRYGRDW